jgi:short-subunit dehydrogenase
MNLNGRRTWVIGASSGIGASVALELARRGARVAISARDAAGLARVAAAARVSADVTVAPLDVTDPDSLRLGWARARDGLGAIELLVYSAGAWTPTDVTRFDAGAIAHQFDVNVVGLARAIELVLPAMVARRQGRIVGLASVAGYRGLPRAEGYGATKAAVISMLESLRLDLAPHGVGVTTVTPGFVATPLTAGNDFPMPFLMEPDEAAVRIADGLERDRRDIAFPRRLAMPLRAAQWLPGPVYDRIAGRLVRDNRRGVRGAK